jgi:hypothetical protein
VGVAQGHDAAAVTACAFDAHGHGLPAHHLAKAGLAVQAQQRAAEFGGRFQEPRGTAEPPKPPPPTSTTMTDRVPGIRGNRCTRPTNSASSGATNRPRPCSRTICGTPRTPSTSARSSRFCRQTTRRSLHFHSGASHRHILRVSATRMAVPTPTAEQRIRHVSSTEVIRTRDCESPWV